MQTKELPLSDKLKCINSTSAFVKKRDKLIILHLTPLILVLLEVINIRWGQVSQKKS